MKLTNVLTCLLLVGGIAACHAPDIQSVTAPTVPSQYRLKSVQSTIPSSVTQTAGASTLNGNTYTYSYDSQNRPVSINRISNGVNSLAVVAYGDPQRNYLLTPDDDPSRTFYVEYPNPADRTSGTITPYPLSPTETDFQTRKYTLFNSKIYTSTVVRNYLYMYDTNQQLTTYSESGSGPTDTNTFKYISFANNIVSEQFTYAAGRGERGTATYTYDNNPNPLFGLMDPNITLVQRLSRNNVLTKTNTSNATYNLGVTTYAYEYNAQGLPTKRTATYKEVVVETLIYTYENY